MQSAPTNDGVAYLVSNGLMKIYDVLTANWIDIIIDLCTFGLPLSKNEKSLYAAFKWCFDTSDFKNFLSLQLSNVDK